MIGLASGLRVFLCTQPADMRRSFDGLSGMTASIIEQNPTSGHLFVFRNRNRDRLKILYWDRDGLAIWYKRLEKGTFQFPADLIDKEKRLPKAEISSEQLTLLLGGIDLRSVEKRKRYHHPTKPR